ncbi:MAG: hypothetical protein ACREIB_05820 [Pseudomonadota bacterium]
MMDLINREAFANLGGSTDLGAFVDLGNLPPSFLVQLRLDLGKFLRGRHRNMIAGIPGRPGRLGFFRGMGGVLLIQVWDCDAKDASPVVSLAIPANYLLQFLGAA